MMGGSEQTGPAPQVYRTSDIDVAAYLMHRGLDLQGAMREKGNGRFDIYIRDPDDKAQDLAAEFLNSPEYNFGSKLRALRKHLLDRRRNGRNDGTHPHPGAGSK